MIAYTRHYLTRYLCICACLTSLLYIGSVLPANAEELRIASTAVPDELSNAPLPQQEPASPQTILPSVIFPEPSQPPVITPFLKPSHTITLPPASLIPPAPIPPTPPAIPSITIPTITYPSIDSPKLETPALQSDIQIPKETPDPQSDIQIPKEIPDLKLTPSQQSPEIQIQEPQEPVLPAPSILTEPQTPQIPKTPQTIIVPTPIMPRFSLEDFLITTDPAHQKPQKEATPEEKPTTKPVPVEPPKEEKTEPKKIEPAKDIEKAEPTQQEPPKKQEEPPKEKPDPLNPQKGDPLIIPEEAKETGKLDFLEGCWVGTRPEYHSKRIVTERFCFDTNGIGKRTILDPGIAGECTGSTEAAMQSNGDLQFSSEEGYCTSGDKWGSAKMLCEGEGDDTPCFWIFSDDNNMKQSYRIRFVRE